MVRIADRSWTSRLVQGDSIANPPWTPTMNALRKSSPGWLLSLVLVSGTLAAAVASFAAAATQTTAATTQDDYFHTGAGARYLVRAKAPLDIEPQRDGLTVLLGSGGNITVLSGPDGKFLVDAGISPSQSRIEAALKELGPTPVRYVVNTHWHWDHTDGDAWLHAAGATIVAQRNTFKHLTETTHVDDWNWTFSPVAEGARP